MFQSEQYKKEQLTIDLVKANLFAFFLIIPLLVVFGLPYYFVWQDTFTFAHIKDYFSGLSFGHMGIRMLLFVIIFLLGIALHELIHGITWAIFAKKGFKSIKFGILWKMFTPYCHCKEPLKVKQYILGAITPAILLGIIPAVIAIFKGNIGLLLFGMFFTMAAAGDFMIIYLLRNENKNDYVEDHPSEAGCFIYRKITE